MEAMNADEEGRARLARDQARLRSSRGEVEVERNGDIVTESSNHSSSPNVEHQVSSSSHHVDRQVSEPLPPEHDQRQSCNTKLKSCCLPFHEKKRDRGRWVERIQKEKKRSTKTV